MTALAHAAQTREETAFEPAWPRRFAPGRAAPFHPAVMSALALLLPLAATATILANLGSGAIGDVIGPAILLGLAVGGGAIALLGAFRRLFGKSLSAHGVLDAALEVIQICGRSDPAAIAGGAVKLVATMGIRRVSSRLPVTLIGILAGLMVRLLVVSAVAGTPAGLVPTLTVATLLSAASEMVVVAGAYGALLLGRLLSGAAARRSGGAHGSGRDVVGQGLANMFDAVLSS